MSEPAISAGAINTGQSRYIWLLILILGIIMTLKYFPGLENEPNYAGATLQTIHPEMFAGDPYRGPELAMGSRILQLSLFYGLARVFGELWLDDRFVSVVYLCFVVLGLVGVDKTARLLGADKLYQRAIILFVFARDHAWLDNKVLLAHHQDVNHSVIAIPLIIWLFYAALARKGLTVVLMLSLVLLATSLRYAPIPILMAMAVVFVIGSRRERWIVGVLSVIGLAASYWVLNHAMSVPEAGRLELWAILRDAAGGDVNPFHGADAAPGRFVLLNGLWIFTLVAAVWLAPQRAPAFLGMKVIMAAGLITWLLGGLYITYAPDAIKYPLLQGIAPTRALAWPQNLAYIAIFAIGLKRLDEIKSLRDSGFILLTFAALFVIGPGNIPLWTVLLGSAAVIVLAAHRFSVALPFADRRSQIPFTSYISTHIPQVTAQTLLIVLAVAYALAIYQKTPAWKTAMSSGVFGNAAPAAWIGVAEEIRRTIPNGALILPITYRDPRHRASPPELDGRPVPRLAIERSLGTRAGRAMPVPEDFPGNFRNPHSWTAGDAQKQVLEQIRQNLEGRDYCLAGDGIEDLRPIPDYIILPRGILGNAGLHIGKYMPDRQIRAYVLLKRVTEGSIPCPTN